LAKEAEAAVMAVWVRISGAVALEADLVVAAAQEAAGAAWEAVADLAAADLMVAGKLHHRDNRL
jgi:hypothetical protein